MNYLSQEWIAEQASVLERNNAALQESIADLHNAATEAPRLRELLASARSESEQLRSVLGEQKSRLAESTRSGLEQIERRVAEVLAAWENPEDEYLRNRLQQSEVKILERLDQVVAEISARVAKVEDRLGRLQAAHTDHAASILGLEAKLSRVSEAQTVLAESVEQEKAASEKLAKTFHDSIHELLRLSSGHHADLESRLASEAEARQRLAQQVEARDAELTNAASETSATLEMLGERLSATEGSVKSLSGTVTRLNAFIAWFKNAGPFARLRGGN